MQRAYLFYIGYNQNHLEEIFTNTYDSILQETLNNVKRELFDKTVKIGEIELWQTSDPHRASDLYWVNLARVKITVIETSGNTQKYCIGLSRQGCTDPWQLDSVFTIK